MSAVDLILVGGGLANGLLALHLLLKRPELNFVVLERGDTIGGNHTWCFHATDLNDAQHALIRPLVAQRWPAQDVAFPQHKRRLASPYLCIPAQRFAEVLTPLLGERLRLRTRVRALQPDRVVLDGGEAIQGTVVDGRGFRPHPALAIRFQSFLGHELQFTEPHGLSAPLIMDATTPQSDGYRFTYVLPLSERTALVEDTGYVDADGLNRASLEQRIAAYCATRGWVPYAVNRTESGVLPITLGGDPQAFWADAGDIASVGLAGGFFHPTTGYSLPDAVRVAELICSLPDLRPAPLFAALRSRALTLWHEQRFYRALNRMLFLAGRPEQRWRVMRRFYGLPQPLIERFYAGQLSLGDKARILLGKPPVPLGGAITALLAKPARSFL